MKTTPKQRLEARSGCHFYHHGICIQSSCYCLKSLKDKLLQDIKDGKVKIEKK